MMRAGRRTAAVLGLLGFLLLCRETALAAPNAVEQERLQNAAGQKKQLEQEQARTEQRISELSGLKSDVSAYVEGLDQHLTEVAGELTRRRSSQVRGRSWIRLSAMRSSSIRI